MWVSATCDVYHMSLCLFTWSFGMSYEDIGMSHEDILSGQKHFTRWIVTLDSEGTRTRWLVRSHTFQHTATQCNRTRWIVGTHRMTGPLGLAHRLALLAAFSCSHRSLDLRALLLVALWLLVLWLPALGTRRLPKAHTALVARKAVLLVLLVLLWLLALATHRLLKP